MLTSAKELDMTDGETGFSPPKILPPHYFMLSVVLIVATLLTPQRLFDAFLARENNV